MPTEETKQQLATYVEEADAIPFLSGFFSTPKENFHNADRVTMDVIREEPHIAVPVHNITSDARKNEMSRWVDKSFEPFILKEEFGIDSSKLTKRQPGMNPYESPEFADAVQNQLKVSLPQLFRKVRRTYELACAQVLQTGAISLIDYGGSGIFALDYLMKSSHKLTAGVTWAADGATGAPITDLETGCTLIRRDGKTRPKKAICGATAIARIKKNADVRAVLDNRGMQVGQIAPEPRGEGATFHGWLAVGAYKLELWSYDDWYIHPQTGAQTPYVGDENVIITSDARMDGTFGSIPLVRNPSAEAMAFIPQMRVSSVEGSIDVSLNAWFTPDNTQLRVAVGTRPLPIPTALDSYACIDITT